MKATLPFTVGLLARKRTLFQLQKAAQSRGLSFNTIDDGGIVTREYSIIVGGDEAAVDDYIKAVEKWAKCASTG